MNIEYFTELLVRLSQHLSWPPLFFIVNSFITMFCVFRTIFDFSSDRWMSVIIFLGFPLFYLNSLSVVRFFTALSIVFYGYRFIVKGNFFRYLLTILIASMFHISSLFAILFYLIRKIRLNFLNQLLIVCSLPLLEWLLYSVATSYSPYYAGYFSHTMIQQGSKAIYFILAVWLLAFYLHNSLMKNNSLAKSSYNIYFIGVIIYSYFYYQGTLGHRQSLYGTIFSLLLIPQLFDLIHDVKLKMILKFILYTMLFIFYYFVLLIGKRAYIPYLTIFH